VVLTEGWLGTAHEVRLPAERPRSHTEFVALRAALLAELGVLGGPAGDAP
jgi:sulfonate transport system ATP-binding protein